MVDVMNIILIYLIQSVLKGENPTYVILLKKRFNVGL